jgi:hypothetical protein
MAKSPKTKREIKSKPSQAASVPPSGPTSDPVIAFMQKTGTPLTKENFLLLSGVKKPYDPDVLEILDGLS